MSSVELVRPFKRANKLRRQPVRAAILLLAAAAVLGAPEMSQRRWLWRRRWQSGRPCWRRRRRPTRREEIDKNWLELGPSSLAGPASGGGGGKRRGPQLMYWASRGSSSERNEPALNCIQPASDVSDCKRRWWRRRRRRRPQHRHPRASFESWQVIIAASFMHLRAGPVIELGCCFFTVTLLLSGSSARRLVGLL